MESESGAAEHGTRGREREAGLTKEAYLSENYFSLKQLFSLAHQLHSIHRLRPEGILEIGIGNGFVSTFLRRAGYDVVTADINSHLEPDVVAAIGDLPAHLAGREFDLVVCCEVLEHMPFEELEQNIAVMSRLGRRLFLTIPDSRRVFGIGGIVRLPKWAPFILNRYVAVPGNGRVGPAHFWEIGSSPGTSMEVIETTLGRYYRDIRSERFALNPYHVSFSATRRDDASTREEGPS